MKGKRERKPGEKKKKLPLGRTLSNNLFALRCIWQASPLYLIVYLGSSFVYGALEFLSESYMLRRVVNGVETGEPTEDIIRFVFILGVVNIVISITLGWFWNVISPVMQRRVSAYVEKMLFRQAAKVELGCYENPAFYDKYVRAMDEAYNRITRVMETLDNLISRVIALSANSVLLFIIDPWLILFGLFPLLLGFFRRLENIAAHDLETARKPVNRRAEYVKRTFYLNEYAKEMRIGGMWGNMLRDLRATFREYRSLVYKYGTKQAIYGYIQRVGLDVVTILGATLYAVWRCMVIGLRTAVCSSVTASSSSPPSALSPTASTT